MAKFAQTSPIIARKSGVALGDRAKLLAMTGQELLVKLVSDGRRHLLTQGRGFSDCAEAYSQEKLRTFESTQ
ncbi:MULTISPECIES: hypothetical protein [unclassified Variovorax]|uniref:hypothetical protein n=1 Tax=unclassified Variovorax TaxID=663243 RepID=UPI00116046B9|nr:MULTISPECIES: hypothetical protein [unclassified Variovorax]